MNKIWLKLYLLFWLLLSLYSFTRVDLNLTLYSYSFLQPIKDSLLYLGYYQRTWATLIYVIIIIGLYFNYLKLIKVRKYIFNNTTLVISILIILSGLIAYPMFSHDIFNYLFNAKMVLVYKANPHLISAIQFPLDSWTRFMHNVHTPAPYAYGWTAISLLPVYLGLPSFTLSLWLTKLLIILFFGLEIFIFYRLSRQLALPRPLSRTLLLALNPLILVETFINGHNDSLMISLALLAYYWFFYSAKKQPWLGFLAFIGSILIKYATLVLTPFLLLAHKLKAKIFDFSGLLLLLILLSRPDQLNSWYLHWGLAFLFLSANKKIVAFGLALSLGGLLRYAPFIYYGYWNHQATVWRWLLLLLPLIFLNYFKDHVINSQKN